MIFNLEGSPRLRSFQLRFDNLDSEVTSPGNIFHFQLTSKPGYHNLWPISFTLINFCQSNFLPDICLHFPRGGKGRPFLTGGWTSHLKKDCFKLDPFPKFWGRNKKSLNLQSSFANFVRRTPALCYIWTTPKSTTQYPPGNKQHPRPWKSKASNYHQSIASMGLVYLPTFTVKIHHSCR